MAGGTVVGAGAAVDALAFLTPPEPGRAAAAATGRTDALNVATGTWSRFDPDGILNAQARSATKKGEPAAGFALIS